ncbi:MAG: T9SS type A sorting domain-containing protein [Ignavibacteria bacterium]
MNYIVSIILLFLTISETFAQQKLIVKSQSLFSHQNKSTINSELHSNNINGTVTTIFPNFRVFPSSQNQSSVSASMSPLSSSLILVGCNTDLGVGYYFTTNSGTQWGGSDILPNSYWFSSNPRVSYFGAQTIVYSYFDNQLVCDKSLNNGLGWSGRVIIPTPTNNFDMNFITVDNSLSSPYYGRIYIAYTDFSFSQPRIMISYSTDGGISFSNPIAAGQPIAGHYEQGCNLQINQNGEVFCFWATPLLTNDIEDHIYFSKSTNGGVNWSIPTTVFTIGGIRGYLLSTGIRVNSFPSVAIDKDIFVGNIYLTWSQRGVAPAGNDADVCFAFSTNGGTSWSTPVRVNNDVLNNNKEQFLPAIAIDQSNGNIVIAYYDTRDALYSDSTNIYLAVSTNAGITFTNIRISDNSQKPSPLLNYADGYFCDYISVVANNKTIFPFWTDVRTGIAQLYSAKVTLSPYIVHSPLKDTENLNGPYTVLANIIPFGSSLNPLESKVFWGIGGITDSITLTSGGGNNWMASIPGNGSTATYYYYIKAKDNVGLESKLPFNAPSSTFSFRTGADTTKPVINHLKRNNPPKTLWPDTIFATVTDNTGIDSVWVRWYKNSPSNGIRHFKLQLLSADFYQGVFNSTQSEVDVNDSIFYRIYARDNSLNHNIDSTVLYKTLIDQYQTIKIGSGYSVTPYPFKTFYTDGRTQMLYTANELIAAGGGLARILAVGFNLANVSPVTFDNLTLRIQNTSLQSLTSFVNSGWTTVYSNTYSFQNSGWQFIIFQSPFIWNGTSNILIEVCYNNSTFNSNSSVYASNSLNKVLHQAQDLPNGNGCIDLTNGAQFSLRPNISFVLNYIIPVRETLIELPKRYFLFQNYPNPFNSTTLIKYELPADEFLTIKLYDLLGREVYTLFNGKQKAGTYVITLDVTDLGLSTGIYLYRLSTNNFSITKKLVYLK